MLYPQRFFALMFLLLAALLSVGVVYGLWTERWTSRTAAQEIMDMERLPLSVDGWEGKTIPNESDEPILPDASSYLHRRYGNRDGTVVASVMLTRGRPGPMVIKHLPTECYPGRGYELVDQPKRFSPNPKSKLPDEFWVAVFKKNLDDSSDSSMSVRVFWSWSATGQWQTPERPRLTFARYSTLYKLYVIVPVLDANEQSDGAPVHDLIEKLTGAMRGSVFPAASE
jgi:hypothetical protein